MSGHSKWSTIKRKKGAIDAARSKVFQKLTKELYVAAKSGDPDPNNNAALRMVIEKAKSENMPKANIQSAIDKASSKNNAEEYESIRYEGYGPAGVAIMVDCLTDNRNRTASQVRSAFTKAGGNLGTTGCVSYLFNKKGIIVIDKESTNMEEDDLMMLALDAGAEDFSSDENCYEITTDPSDFSSVRDALEEAGLEFVEAEVQMVPTTYVSLSEADGEKMQRLIDNLEDLDDVMNVYHNWEQE